MHKPNINLLSNLYIFFLHSFFFLPLPPILGFFFCHLSISLPTYISLYLSTYHVDILLLM